MESVPILMEPVLVTTESVNAESVIMGSVTTELVTAQLVDPMAMDSVDIHIDTEPPIPIYFQQPKPFIQPVSLRDDTTFLPFGDLPDCGDMDTRPFESPRHWCFLGEIADLTFVSSDFPLVMHVKDIQRKSTLVSFYTGSNGKEVGPQLRKRGYTVAVLYAYQSVLVNGGMGIRHDNLSYLKVFPLSLNELFALNDRIQQFSTTLETSSIDGVNLRQCHGCGRKVSNLKKCQRCDVFWYCDKACQILGWNENGHKTDCRLLKDPNLQRLFAFEWKESHEKMRFSLPIVSEEGEEKEEADDHAVATENLEESMRSKWKC